MGASFLRGGWMGFGGSDCAVKVMLLLNRRPPADSVSKLVVFGAPPVGGVKPRARPARRSSKSPARHPDFYIRHILVRRAVVRKHERGEVSRKLRQHHIDPLPPSYQGFFCVRHVLCRRSVASRVQNGPHTATADPYYSVWMGLMS